MPKFSLILGVFVFIPVPLFLNGVLARRMKSLNQMITPRQAEMIPVGTLPST